ncbi:uncharacterized protein BP01DRAFT_383286 [Aspergillus saccharolyticus JOP 1030-1]|uniref:F-box domain-containing protein n=1 Tax=Aspergillus saccharolyticus JOP 1030-1 TaxID=1450539 RepID=A0A318ZLP6_9EURO|nr:hypothetical protein BP01DRAFT_383286 [Aspergillus saccharolyticus JOP 1030-1]PYH44720.1 hypothetical protein BP01DRAFT_383286 [Aspergillus saccharolyticus JOP 1030-1]
MFPTRASLARKVSSRRRKLQSTPDQDNEVPTGITNSRITIMDLPPEIKAMIVFCLAIPPPETHQESKLDGKSPHFDKHRYDVMPDIISLRLVNKTFSMLAAKHLFKYIHVQAACVVTTSIYKLWALSQSQYAGCVRHLSIDMSHYCDAAKGSVKQGLEQVFRTSLPRLSGLETIQCHFTSMRMCCQLYQHKLLRQVFTSEDHTRLKNIHISFHGVPNYSKKSIQDDMLPSGSGEQVVQLLKDIRCLDLRQYDFGGRDIQNPSPAGDFAAWLLGVVENNMDQDFNWSQLPGSSFPATTMPKTCRLALETLVLDGIPLQYSALMCLLTLARRSLRRVELRSVALQSGDWCSVLSVMGSLPHLTYFRFIRLRGLATPGSTLIPPRQLSGPSSVEESDGDDSDDYESWDDEVDDEDRGDEGSDDGGFSDLNYEYLDSEDLDWWDEDASDQGSEDDVSNDEDDEESDDDGSNGSDADVFHAICLEVVCWRNDNYFDRLAELKPIVQSLVHRVNENRSANGMCPLMEAYHTTNKLA